MDEFGYRMTWARHPVVGKIYFNVWAPSGAHIGSGFDREILTAVCTVHREKTAEKAAKQRQEYSRVDSELSAG